jgi:hypothetical protein
MCRLAISTTHNRTCLLHLTVKISMVLWCRLEFVTAVGCVVMTIAVYVPNSFDDSRWIRYTAFLRLLRLLRLARLLKFPTMLRFLYVIVSVEHIKIFYETFLAMMPAAVRLIKVRLIYRIFSS